MARPLHKLPWSSGRGLFARLKRLVLRKEIDARPTIDWTQIEQAYEETLSADVRTSLATATHLFILLEDSERAAEPVADAKKAIDDIEADANKLQATLTRLMGSDAGVVAINLIEQSLKGSHARANFFEPLTMLLASFPDACATAREDLSKWPSKKAGDAWSEWIRQITKILRDAELPCGVSKDDQSKKSRFVALIEALQSQLPEESRRHTHSAGALATAIVSARSRER